MPNVGIIQLIAHVVRLPLRRPIRHASFARTSTDNLLVRCALSDGSVGWGEGVPREYVTGESADTAFELLKAADLGSLMARCGDFPAAVALADQLSLPAVKDDDRDCGGNAARCALELAVLDAFGRSFGENLTTVTKIAAPDLFEFQPRVHYSGAIASSRGVKLRALALGYRLTGFRQVKVKVGISGYDDVARLRTIRRWSGHGMGLRIDANEAWTVDEAVKRIAALNPFQLECVEQPVAHEQVAGLADVRKKLGVPIMLDESLCSQVDADRAVAGGWCDRFNLRLSKCGGFLRTLRLAVFALRNGLSYQLGCQVGESAILSGAGRHFATSVRGLTAIEGSYDRHLLGESLSFADLTFGRGGWAPALGGSGHGAWIDEEAIDRRSIRHEVLVG